MVVDVVRVGGCLVNVFVAAVVHLRVDFVMIVISTRFLKVFRDVRHVDQRLYIHNNCDVSLSCTSVREFHLCVCPDFDCSPSLFPLVRSPFGSSSFQTILKQGPYLTFTFTRASIVFGASCRAPVRNGRSDQLSGRWDLHGDVLMRVCVSEGR